MKRQAAMRGLAVGILLVVTVTACGSPQENADGSGVMVAHNEALSRVVRPSEEKGGTLKLALSDAFDSLDPGNTYYTTAWNFSRLYARTLLMFKPTPGKDGLTLTPDLAEGLGQSSADRTAWSYKIKRGVKFEDGSPVTAKDVKYAVERSFAKDVLPNGPGYFQQYIDPGWPGPYKDKAGLKAVETPDDYTIVFRLKEPFADFDYLATTPQTAPVPRAKDAGEKYQLHPVSTGPYMFGSHRVGESLVLVKNPNWGATNDTNRKQLVDRIEVTFKIEASELDRRLLAGTVHADLGGTGLRSAARVRVLRDATLTKSSDNPLTGAVRYAALASSVKPLDNAECRKAVHYATDKAAVQAAVGGPIGGDIATTMLPPTVVGHQRFDLYPSGSDHSGDLGMARRALQACGQPAGFSTNIAVGTDPTDVATAEAVQQGLARVGIKAQIQKFPSGRYYSDFVGAPNYVRQHNLGLILFGWQADWPSGGGFLQPLVDGRLIMPAGNTNLAQLNDPIINQLFDQANASTDVSERGRIYGEIDRRVIEGAHIVPLVYEKTLLYRGPELANVYVHPAYGMYDWMRLSLK